MNEIRIRPEKEPVLVIRENPMPLYVYVGEAGNPDPERIEPTLKAARFHHRETKEPFFLTLPAVEKRLAQYESGLTLEGFSFAHLELARADLVAFHAQESGEESTN